MTSLASCSSSSRAGAAHHHHHPHALHHHQSALVAASPDHHRQAQQCAIRASAVSCSSSGSGSSRSSRSDEGACSTLQQCAEMQAAGWRDGSSSRRSAVVGMGTLLTALAGSMPAPGAVLAAGFNKQPKRKLKPEDYVYDEQAGLKIVELKEGFGPPIKAGDKAKVHYDCTFRGIDAVSSRSARLLGGNRVIAEPYEFVVGEPVLGVTLKKAEAEGGNGLFSGSSGPKPPQALSKALIGMKKGGQRSILVDSPELGYAKGMMEIPAGATFELRVEVLDAKNREVKEAK